MTPRLCPVLALLFSFAATTPVFAISTCTLADYSLCQLATGACGLDARKVTRTLATEIPREIATMRRDAEEASSITAEGTAAVGKVNTYWSQTAKDYRSSQADLQAKATMQGSDYRYPALAAQKELAQRQADFDKTVAFLKTGVALDRGVDQIVVDRIVSLLTENLAPLKPNETAYQYMERFRAEFRRLQTVADFPVKLGAMGEKGAMTLFLQSMAMNQPAAFSLIFIELVTRDGGNYMDGFNATMSKVQADAVFNTQDSLASIKADFAAFAKANQRRHESKLEVLGRYLHMTFDLAPTFAEFLLLLI